ncbi:hypothetical protein F5B21DRAFT_477854 [Xylaria acuta]|nr:hypothetical protein F5B21DRAFT_477854 [Xylaria acuta]
MLEQVLILLLIPISSVASSAVCHSPSQKPKPKIGEAREGGQSAIAAAHLQTSSTCFAHGSTLMNMAVDATTKPGALLCVILRQALVHQCPVPTRVRCVVCGVWWHGGMESILLGAWVREYRACSAYDRMQLYTKRLGQRRVGAEAWLSGQISNRQNAGCPQDKPRRRSISLAGHRSRPFAFRRVSSPKDKNDLIASRG